MASTTSFTSSADLTGLSEPGREGLPFRILSVTAFERMLLLPSTTLLMIPDTASDTLSRRMLLPAASLNALVTMFWSPA
eukprot:scaffold354411_cov33-Prasinocladus_malaysianus.AAC.1